MMHGEEQTWTSSLIATYCERNIWSDCYAKPINKRFISSKTCMCFIHPEARKLLFTSIWHRLALLRPWSDQSAPYHFCVAPELRSLLCSHQLLWLLGLLEAWPVERQCLEDWGRTEDADVNKKTWAMKTLGVVRSWTDTHIRTHMLRHTHTT